VCRRSRLSRPERQRSLLSVKRRRNTIGCRLSSDLRFAPFAVQSSDIPLVQTAARHADRLIAFPLRRTGNFAFALDSYVHELRATAQETHRAFRDLTRMVMRDDDLFAVWSRSDDSTVFCQTISLLWPGHDVNPSKGGPPDPLQQASRRALSVKRLQRSEFTRITNRPLRRSRAPRARTTAEFPCFQMHGALLYDPARSD